ncbi:hypothetical protein [Emcibacter sp. SYSU 3D8]|uniref:hypothetical protein n=1 Tax=Emcibacter sp. SYSU 3D8 TaxID=3133969 RepID=UPI0031FE7F65
MSRCLVVLAALILASCESGGPWPNLADVPPEVKPGFQQASTLTPTPPPPASTDEAQAAMANAADAITDLGIRLDQRRDRFARLQRDLASQSGLLDADIAAGKGASADGWSKAQADLSRLNADVATLRDLRADVGADAAAGGGIVADLEPAGRAALDDAAKARLETLRTALDRVLAGLGALDRDIAEATARWQDKSSAQAATLDKAPPPLAGAQTAMEPAAGPARPSVRKPRPKKPAAAQASAPRDSGDRFKGRQPLVTLTFEDPDLDFETRLRGLIDKVRAQYPDIAFDIETVGAPPAQLGKVRGMLKGLDIPSDVFVTPVTAGAVPAIKLYPR